MSFNDFKTKLFYLFWICKGQGYFLLRIIKLCMCICACSVMFKTLCDLMNCSPPASSVHGIFQARILEWVAIPFSRGSFWPRDQTLKSCIGRQIPYHCTTRNHFPLCKLKRTWVPNLSYINYIYLETIKRQEVVNCFCFYFFSGRKDHEGTIYQLWTSVLHGTTQFIATIQPLLFISFWKTSCSWHQHSSYE